MAVVLFEFAGEVVLIFVTEPVGCLLDAGSFREQLHGSAHPQINHPIMRAGCKFQFDESLQGAG